MFLCIYFYSVIYFVLVLLFCLCTGSLSPRQAIRLILILINSFILFTLCQKGYRLLQYTKTKSLLTPYDLVLPVALSETTQYCHFCPVDGVLHYHLFPLHLRLLHCVSHPSLQLLLPGLTSPNRRLQPAVQRHVCLTDSSI